MNISLLLLAILAAFVFVFASDFLIHGVKMVPSTRHDEPVAVAVNGGASILWMMAGQFLAAATFVILWTIGCAERGTLGGACLYGLLMGLFHQSNTLITKTVMHLQLELATKWFASGLAQVCCPVP